MSSEPDPKALEAAARAVLKAWEESPDCPGQMYGREAEAIARAAVAAYVSTSDRERVLIDALEPFARMGDLLREFSAFSGRDVSGFYAQAFDRARAAMSATMNSDAAPPAAQEKK